MAPDADHERSIACSAKRASLDEITSAVFRFDALLDTDPDGARARLRRWLPDGQVRVARTTDGGPQSELYTAISVPSRNDLRSELAVRFFACRQGMSTARKRTLFCITFA